MKNFFNLFKRKIKVGVAFGGGGAKGMAHIGVIKAFEEYGLDFDYVAGTSVGSIMGSAYASGMKSSEILKIAKSMKTSDIRTSKVFFVPSKTEGIESMMRDNFGDINIENLKKPFALFDTRRKCAAAYVISFKKPFGFLCVFIHLPFPGQKAAFTLVLDKPVYIMDGIAQKRTDFMREIFQRHPFFQTVYAFLRTLFHTIPE